MSADDYRWHFDYIRLAWDAGFTFDKNKYPNLDKNKICLVDIDRIIKERDVASVERFLPTVVHYFLENDQAELLDTNFVKMFRLGQLSVEYLLFCKKYLDNTVVLLKKEISKLKEENKELKLFTEELENHIATLTKQSFITTFKCDKCPKVFSSEEYLNSHSKRRHSGDNNKTISNESDQLQSEIKELKERLNIAEKKLQEKDEKVQNVKSDDDDNENKLRVNEVLEKFDRFKDKVENDLRMLQMEKNFYEEKYSKLFDVVFDSNKVNGGVVQQTHPGNKSEELPEEKNNVIPERIEITTQTEEKEAKKLQMETVHHKNIYEFKQVEDESDKRDLHESIKQKISQFEEQIESKITSGLSNIERQMEAFWGKLSEIELKRETNIMEDAQNPPHQEFVETRTQKPKIKPRTKLSKPSKFPSDTGENAKKLKAEIDKMYEKPETRIVPVQAIGDHSPVKIPDALLASPESSDSETNSDSESSADEVLPRERHESKPSVSGVVKRPVTSLKKATSKKEQIQNVRDEITDALNDKLQDIGISPNWTGIPRRTYEKAQEIVKHQASITKRMYPNFDSVKRSIVKSLNKRLGLSGKAKRHSSMDSGGKRPNVINIKYRKKKKDPEIESENQPSIITIRNRSLYDTDSESEEIEPPKSPKKVSEAVPSYSAVMREFQAAHPKNIDTDSDINSIILPKENAVNESQNKSVLKSYPSMGSITKKKVLFDIENDTIEIDSTEVKPSEDISEDHKPVDNGQKPKKNDSSLSDFDLSEL